VSHRVLLSLEDNDGEYYLIRMAVREAGMPVEMCRVVNGEEALHFLHRSNGYEIAPRPDLILLNWNLPRKNGLEVLPDIQASDSLRSIPVFLHPNGGEEKSASGGCRRFHLKTADVGRAR
jgi:two-component system, chemotaxis family, response regulator Rcp1